MSRRRGRRGSRCRDCGAPVVFFRSPVTKNWRPFDPKPISHGQLTPTRAYPIENNAWAWPYRDLVEDLMVRRHCSQTEAEDEAHAMPWHTPHDCPKRPQEDR